MRLSVRCRRLPVLENWSISRIAWMAIQSGAATTVQFVSRPLLKVADSCFSPMLLRFSVNQRSNRFTKKTIPKVFAGPYLIHTINYPAFAGIKSGVIKHRHPTPKSQGLGANCPGPNGESRTTDKALGHPRNPKGEGDRTPALDQVPGALQPIYLINILPFQSD